MGLFEAISHAIGQDLHPSPSNSSLMNLANFADGDTLVRPRLIKKNVVSSQIANKPILQLNSFPMTLNPDNFKNPLSTSNPEGSLEALWNFRQLIDPIPEFSTYYSPTSRSSESTLSMIIKGASVSDDAPFPAEVIAESRKQLSLSKFANMDGTPGTWAPVYATPSDWYDTTNGRYKSLDFDLNDIGLDESPFATIGSVINQHELKIGNHGNTAKTKKIEQDSTFNKVTLKYMLVNISRPWYSDMLFDVNGWFLAGQPAGFCSSGRLDVNKGTFPLLPTSLILATDVGVDAKWSKGDQLAIDDAVAKGEHVSVGNIVISAPANYIQVIGWVTELIPYSPKIP